MAHSALHFTLGFAAATAVTLPPLLRAWRRQGRLSPHFGRWLLAAGGAGLYAAAPSLLRWAGVPATVCQGWWMNVFLLHPLLTRLHPGGQILAVPALLCCFAAPYVLLLLAIRRARRRAA